MMTTISFEYDNDDTDAIFIRDTLWFVPIGYKIVYDHTDFVVTEGALVLDDHRGVYVKCKEVKENE